MKKCLITNLVFALVIGILPASYAKEAYILKFATLAPEGTSWMNTMRELGAEVEKESQGRIKFRFYPGGVMGDELDVLRKMRINQINGAGFSGQGLGEIVPEVRVMDIPYLFEDYRQVDYVHNELFDYFAQKFSEKGYELMGWSEVGFVYIFSKTPIEKLDDIKNVKLWSWQGDPIAKEAFTSMGLTTIPLPVTDVLTSLQVGMIDSVYSPPIGAIALQWFTRVNYMVSLPITHASGAVLISKKFYDGLPPDLQELLKQKFNKHLVSLVKQSREDNKLSVETLKKNGITITEITDPNRIKEFSDACKNSWHSLINKQFSKELLDKILSLIEKANEEHQ
ncbi:TRAP transporter substrate-binding protein DctP [bacterium]|nr:TRAP transporter substrate-binding protein DctP [bacterium]